MGASPLPQRQPVENQSLALEVAERVSMRAVKKIVKFGRWLGAFAVELFSGVEYLLSVIAAGYWIFK